MTKTSNSTIDPNGHLPPSTRDVLAAHIAAAMFMKEKGHSTRPGPSIGREAYRFADDMLLERKKLDDEAFSS